MTAQEIMRAKRAHWGIENSLHWVLDIAFREDESRARKGDSAALRKNLCKIINCDKNVRQEWLPNSHSVFYSIQWIL